MNGPLLICITAHPIFAGSPFLAFVVAAPTVVWVITDLHTSSSTASLPIPTSSAALPAVEHISVNVYALLPAAVGAAASGLAAQPGEVITGHRNPSGVVLGKHTLKR